MAESIRLLKRKEIDEHRWNDCVMQGVANLAYGHSAFLDSICDSGWVGLVYGDYEAVFPLPLKKKWGIIPYIVQPKFCQQLGAFGHSNNVQVSDFLAAIPWYYFRVRLHLNPYFSGHSMLSHNKKELLTEKTNFILNLSDAVTITKDGLKNIKSVSHFDYLINVIGVDEVIELYKQRWGELNSQLLDIDYRKLSSCLNKIGPANDLSKTGLGFVIISAHRREEENSDNSMEANPGSLLGAGIFLISGLGKTSFSHFILGAPNTRENESTGIMHGILNRAIEHFKPHRFIFDFEGSSIPSVADFYRKFNPINKPFLYLKKGI